VKTNINSLEIHPLLSNNRHPVDGALGVCWFKVAHFHTDSRLDGHMWCSAMTPLIPIMTFTSAMGPLLHLFSLFCPWPNPSFYEKVYDAQT